MISKKEIFIVIILISITVARFFFFLPKPPEYNYAIGEKVSLTGIVSDYPDVRLNNKRVTITPVGQESSILVVLPLSTKISYGDKVEISGILKTPQNFETEIGKEFNYVRYLSNKNIYFIIDKGESSTISSGHGSKIISLLFKFRDSFLRNINISLISPESDLASGLLLGVRGGFDKELREDFISTGTIHIIALSGYNVTIVAENLMKIFGLVFSKAVSVFFGVFSIILFVLLSGASATAVRAGIMASIALFARLTGRTYDAGRALVIAGLCMIAYDARVITDVSFQLSFLATIGVIFVTPKIIKWFWFVPIRFGLRDIVSTTVGATMSVLPLLLYSTGVLSLVSLPANILILSLIPVTMLFVFVVGVLGFISPIISLPFSYIAYGLLTYILSVIKFFASLSFASITIKSFPLIFVFIIYGLIFWWLFRKK